MRDLRPRSIISSIQITTYSDSGKSVQDQLVQFRDDLEAVTVEMKREQNRRESLLESFSQKYSERMMMKQVWKRFEENRRERQQAK